MANPSGLDTFRNAEPFPFARGAGSAGLDRFRSGEPLPAGIVAVTPIEFASSVTITVSPSADLLVEKLLSSSIAVTVSISTAVAVGINLSSTIAITVSQTSALEVAVHLASAIAIRVSTSGVVRVAATPTPTPPARGGSVLVTLTHEASITRVLPISALSWQLPTSRQVGSATLFVPATSDAFKAMYISEERSFWIRIQAGVLGIWDGYATDVTISAAGAQITARELAGLLDVQTAPAGQTYRSVTAGVIVRAAVAAAAQMVAGPAILPGTFMEAPPLVSYELSGQPVREVLDAMTERTGHEWVIGDDRRLSWVARAGSYRSGWLAAEGDIVVDARQIGFDNQAASVTVRTPDGQFYTGRA